MLSTPVLKRFFPLFPSGAVVLLAVLGHLSAPVCLSGVFASAPAWYWVNYLVTIYPFLMEWPFVPSTEMFGLDKQRIVWLVCLGAGTLVSLTEYAAGWATESDDAGWATGYTMHILSILLFVLFHFHRKRREIAAIEDDPHLVDHGKMITRSYAYLVFYSVLGMRIPDFLAFGSVRMFAQIKDYEHDLLRYAVSLGFLGFMSAYVRMLRTVVHCMLQEIMRLSDPPAATPQQHQAQLAFQMKIAEQDLTADHASLFAVPMLITAFAFLAGRDALSVANKNRFEIEQIRVEHYDGTPLDVSHLWLRFAIMFVARWLSSQVSKSVFDFKIKATSSSIQQQQDQATAATSVKPCSSDEEEESDDEEEARQLVTTPSTEPVLCIPSILFFKIRIYPQGMHFVPLFH
ncbi:hypothetical protein BASA81_010131 [Batrachochytrium salamandrivorans]|nr:hypothetical protein BASA81_010131 [Batrachochytrium salamandrivorans]